MGIERLRYWHWMIIGVAMGCIYAAIRTGIGFTEPAGTESVTVATFEALAMGGNSPEEDLRNIRNFRIHRDQGISLKQVGNKQDKADVISFEAVKVNGRERKPVMTLTPGKSVPSAITADSAVNYYLHSAKDERRELWSVTLKKGDKLGFKVADGKTVAFVNDKLTNLPQFDKGQAYVWKEGVVKGENVMRVLTLSNKGTRNSVLGKVDQMTGVEYLDKLKQYLEKHKATFPNHVKLDHKISWMEIPKFAYPFYGAIGLVAIGVFWPMLLNFLVASGYGRKYDDAKDDAYLARFKGGKEAQKKAKAGVTAEDMEKLRALEAELEESLKSGDMKPSVAAAATVKKPEIKKLDAAPVEPAPEPKKEFVRKSFGEDQGDFYPTEVHGKQKH